MGVFGSRAFPLSLDYNLCARDCGYKSAPRARRIGRSLPQQDAITHQADPAIHVAAPFGIIDSVAVAHIETVLAAICPDCVLDEPGKGLRKARIELPSIDPLGHGCNNVGAAARPVAGKANRREPYLASRPQKKVTSPCYLTRV